MTDFDPDAYLAEKGAPSPSAPPAIKQDPSADSVQVQNFDPDQYLDQKGISSQPDESLLEQAGTAIEQGVSGATLGASKVLETHGIPALGIPALTTPENIAAREAKYPTTSTVSNILGTGAMIYGTGGLGGLAEGAGLAGRLGTAALEGGIIGGANKATDDWSQNKPLDAQKIAASAGIGSLLGLGGAGIVEGIKGTASGVGKALDYFKGLAEDASTGEGYLANLGKAYISAGSNATEMVNGLVGHLNDLYKGAKSAVTSMYEGAGQAKLGASLQDVSVADAKSIAQQTIDKVKALSVPPDGESALGGISSSSAKIVASNLSELGSKLSEAGSALDVHNAMTDFATNLDKGIKFDKLPTASQQFDQEALRGIRRVIRGDLANPEIWGESAPVFQELSDHYSQYINARKNFERDFMKNRIAPNGQTIKVVDPAKINTYFKNITAPGQSLRTGSLGDFINSGVKNANYANEFEGFQKGLEDLSSQIGKIKDFTGKADVLNQIKAAQASHRANLGLFATLEALPLPGPAKAAVLALQRYVGKGSSYEVGSDLGRSARVASTLAKNVESITNKIGSGVQGLFKASASESRKAVP